MKKKVHKIRKLPDKKPNPPSTPFTIKLLSLEDQPDSMKKESERSRAICNSKHKYSDIKQAMEDGARVGHHVYECHICKAWHLTSRDM